MSIFLSFVTAARPPQLRTATFLSYICRIYTTGFGQYGTLSCLADSSAPQMPYMRFLFVRPRVCFRLTSDSASRRTPLPLANTSYCQACSGLSPPSYCPFWANTQKQRPRLDAVGMVMICVLLIFKEGFDNKPRSALCFKINLSDIFADDSDCKDLKSADRPNRAKYA